MPPLSCTPIRQPSPFCSRPCASASRARCVAIYDLVLHEVELPLLREVLHWSGGNQSKAAAALSINRATLRKKLAARGLS